MARARASPCWACCACRTRRRAGSRSIAGIISTPTRSRPAQPAGELLLGPCRLGRWSRTASSAGCASSSATPRTCCAIRSTCWLERNCDWVRDLLPWPVYFLGGFAGGAGAGRQPGERGAVRPEPAGLGRVRADRLVWHITWSVNSVTHLLGLPQLRHRREQPQQLVGRPLQQRRRLAQQPPRRPALRPPRPPLVGNRHHLSVAARPRRARPCLADRGTEPPSGDAGIAAADSPVRGKPGWNRLGSVPINPVL